MIAFGDSSAAESFKNVTTGSTLTEEFASLRESLRSSGAVVSLPELHGGMTGALCAGGPVAAERWLDDFFADHDAAGLADSGEALHALVRTTWRLLEAREPAFEPLLPGDDETLEEQVSSLAHWCHGFLIALGGNAPELTASDGRASSGDAASSDEVREILADFAEISRAGVGEEDEADRDRADFALAELKEYARVSAQILFESLEPRRASSAAAAARDLH